MKRIRARRLSSTIAGVLAVAACLGGGAGRAAAPSLSTSAAHDAMLAAVTACGPADARNAQSCATRSMAAAAKRLVGDAAAAAPKGVDGVPAWIRVAASLKGLTLPTVAVPRDSLRDAVHALYREARLPVTAPMLRRADAALARVSPATAAQVAPLVNAVRAAFRLSNEATRGTGLETVTKDLVHAMQIVQFAETAPGGPHESLRQEALRDEAILARVDVGKIAAGALALATALSHYDRTAVTDDVDVPFIFVGGDGDTTHSDTRVILIDNSGNDTYTDGSGSGFGVGAALQADFGGGNDTYAAEQLAQGGVEGGAALLYDDGGSDSYSVRKFGQGFSAAGAGILYDAGVGDDTYLSPGFGSPDSATVPIGTKAASLGGLGVLVDEGGDDYYRQDLLDGFVYGGSGGAGLLASLGDGNDTYRSDAGEEWLCAQGVICEDLGFFAGPIQVSAEVYATAVLYDEGGDDLYQCGAYVRQGCQGAGGPGSLALLWDRGGNDTYTMGESVSPDEYDDICAQVGSCPPDPLPVQTPVLTMGQGAGYDGVCLPCPPPAIGVLYDESGSDSYTAARWAQGYGTFGAIGMLYDTGGAADTHTMETAPLYGSRSDGSSWVDGVLGVGRDE